MPNVRRQIVGLLDDLGPAWAGKRGLHVQASDGRSLTFTRADLLAKWATLAGTRAQKRAALFAWLKGRLTTALGAEQIDTGSVTADANETTGDVTTFEVG